MVLLVGVAVDAAEDLEEVQLAVRLVAVALLLLLLLPLLLLAVQQHQRHSPRAGSRGNNESPKPPKPRWSKRKRRERAWLPWLRNLLITPDEVNSSYDFVTDRSAISRFGCFLDLVLYQDHVTLFACTTATFCPGIISHFWRQLPSSFSIHLLY